MPDTQDPGSPRRVSFARPDWQPDRHRPQSQDQPHISSVSNNHLDPSSAARPGAPRSISFAHTNLRRSSLTPRRPPPARSLSFCDTRWELNAPNLALRQDSVAGPFAFLNPTTAIFDICGGDTNSLYDITDQEHGQRAKVRWNAREFRKGIYFHQHTP